MPHTIVVVASYDPSYLRITEHAVRQSLSQSRRVAVLDASRAMATPVGSYHHGILRLLGTPYPGHDLATRLGALGAEVIGIDEITSPEGEAELSEVNASALETAIGSALITFFRTEEPRESRRIVRRTTSRLDQEGRRLYQAVSAMIEKYPDADQVIVPNGRFPGQMMATMAAHDRGRATIHYEKGETPDGAYFQPYAPQSRFASQAAVESVLADHDAAAIDAIADAWLSHRAPAADSRNEFAALWSDGLPSELADGVHGRIAGFFTSSQDEFQSLGPEWQLHQWATQFEAFDLVMTRLEAEGYLCYLRVHPNLATKSHESFRGERDKIRALSERHPNLVVIWHDDFVNSYALLAHTDAVIVWDSTIGLEASARGLPVWTMATSRYGLTADVRELLSADALTDNELTAWDVDAHAAKRFIAYLVLRDSQMPTSFEAWEPWAPGPGPRGLPFARVFVSGGNPTPGTAIGSLLDVYRHRSFRSSIRSLRGR